MERRAWSEPAGVAMKAAGPIAGEPDPTLLWPAAPSLVTVPSNGELADDGATPLGSSLELMPAIDSRARIAEDRPRDRGHRHEHRTVNPTGRHVAKP